MWTFEFYRILTAQRMAQALLEAEHSRLIAPASARRQDREAAPERRLPRIAKALLRDSILSLVHAVRRGLGRWPLDAHR